MCYCRDKVMGTVGLGKGEMPTPVAALRTQGKVSGVGATKGQICPQSPLPTYRGGAQSCCVQSSSVPTYVLFLQVTLTTSIPAR